MRGMLVLVLVACDGSAPARDLIVQTQITVAPGEGRHECDRHAGASLHRRAVS